MKFGANVERLREIRFTADYPAASLSIMAAPENAMAASAIPACQIFSPTGARTSTLM